MANTQLSQYEGPAAVFYQGQLLAEASSASFTVTANNNKVLTMRRNLAGKSDGARESSINIDSAIPVEGFEQEFVKRVLDGKFLRVVFKVGGARFQFTCWCEDAGVNASVDSASNVTATFVGGPPDIK